MANVPALGATNTRPVPGYVAALAVEGRLASRSMALAGRVEQRSVFEGGKALGCLRVDR